MSDRFEFATAAQIVFGAGKMKDVGPMAATLGNRVLIAAGIHGVELERITGILQDSGVESDLFPVDGEPSVSTVLLAVQAAREFRSEFVIGFGGGSALDTGKAVAALLTNPGDPLDYLEVVGRSQPLRARPAPYIAIPTTAGTGSEVTRNAVLSVPEKRVKVSLRSPHMLAKIALIDPELTYGLPPAVTASTGMDALSQVIEPYVSRRANVMTDLFCREGITRVSRSLLQAYQNGADQSAREDMALGSLMGGLALANAGLGAVHGFAGPIGGMFDVPHGAVCAVLLPPVVTVNTRALLEREPQNPALARYIEIARWVTGDPNATIAGLSLALDEMRSALYIPPLREYGIHASDLDALVEKSAVASNMKANPLTLTSAELRQILEIAL